MLTKEEIYRIAESSLTDTYNYQRKRVREMKRKANADIERAKQWNILASRFDELSKETFDNIMQLIELTKRGQQKTTQNHTEELIELLDKIKEENPEQRISIETPKGSAQLKIGDALIYEDAYGCIVIDSE